MIVGVGVDNVDVKRIAKTLERYGERFEQKVFTPEEIIYCRWIPGRSAERYAARFAAKEAFAKAIGTGIRLGFRWREVYVGKEPSGRPVLHLSGGMAERYGHLICHISLSHTDNMAMAYVVLEEG
ncbi:MAG: holo-ACP synthase [Chlorobi bacterium]|nr:holo-ACP synthase [Chlorobiota bacterium]